MTERPELQECAERTAEIAGELFDCTSISMLVRRAGRGYEVAMAANRETPDDAEINLVQRIITTLDEWADATNRLNGPERI